MARDPGTGLSGDEPAGAPLRRRAPDEAGPIRPQTPLCEVRSQSDLERALERYLQGYEARERRAREGLPRLENQREALEAAGTQAALKEALQHDP